MNRRGTGLVATLIGVLAGCAPAGHAARAGLGAPSQLVLADSWEPRSLDPLVLQGTQVALVNDLLFSYLLNVDNNANPVPEVAREVPTLRNGGISPDGKTIRYHLRRDVRFSDGVPLTARDAAFTFKAVMNPRNAAASRYGYDIVESASAPNDDTLVVRLKRPFSPIISTFLAPGGNYGIFPEHLLRGVEPLERSTFATKPIGSGPYVVTRWDRADKITLSVNPHYFGRRPSIGRIVWKFVPSPQTMLSQLRTGEVDAVFGATPALLPQLRSLRGYRIAITPVTGFAQLQFNTTDAVFRDPRVRQAFSMLVDWPEFVAHATEANYSADGAMRGILGWAYDRRVGYPPYNPRAAAALLSAAGWRIGPDGERRHGEEALEISVALPSDEDTLARILTQIQVAATNLGIRVTPRVLAKSLYKSWEGPINQGRYQASIDRYASAPDPDPGWMIDCAHRSPNGFNRSRYCDASVDAALQDAVATYDRDRRLRDYAFVQRRLASDVPFYPIFQDREIDVVPANLQGFVPSTQDMPLHGIQNWSLK